MILSFGSKESLTAFLVILCNLLLGCFAGMALSTSMVSNECNAFIDKEYIQNPAISSCVYEKTGYAPVRPYPKSDFNMSIPWNQTLH